MNNREEIARRYFEAFHAGRLDEVFGYFSGEGVVKYGTEPKQPAKVFSRKLKR